MANLLLTLIAWALGRVDNLGEAFRRRREIRAKAYRGRS